MMNQVLNHPIPVNKPIGLYRPIRRLKNASDVAKKILLIRSLFSEGFVCDIICEYVLFDRKEYDLRVHFQLNIMNPIKLSVNDRIGNRNRYPEHWVYHFPEEYLGNENLQMQAINCRFCGGYMMSTVFYQVPDNILCDCDRDMRQREEFYHKNASARTNEEYHFLMNYYDIMNPSINDEEDVNEVTVNPMDYLHLFRTILLNENNMQEDDIETISSISVESEHDLNFDGLDFDDVLHPNVTDRRRRVRTRVNSYGIQPYIDADEEEW